MTDVIKSTKGGKRPGAGRPPGSGKKDTVNVDKSDYKFDVIKEQIDLYKKLKKQNDPKTLPLRASMLKDIAPYLQHKMPTADTNADNKEPTVIEIVDVGNDKDGGIV